MDWKTMLSYISGSVDEELLLRNEYLVAENRVLRNQLQGRLRLTDGERRSLAELGKRLGKQALDEVASIVNPDTILGWHRRLVAKKFDGSKLMSLRIGSGRRAVIQSTPSISRNSSIWVWVIIPRSPTITNCSMPKRSCTFST